MGCGEAALSRPGRPFAPGRAALNKRRVVGADASTLLGFEPLRDQMLVVVNPRLGALLRRFGVAHRHHQVRELLLCKMEMVQPPIDLRERGFEA